MKQMGRQPLMAILYVVSLALLLFGCGGGDQSAAPRIPGKTFGGAGDEGGAAAAPTADGGYIITGYTTSLGAGGADLYLLKTDAVGNKLWQKTFGGSGDDYGAAVQPTEDGGYIIAGSTNSPGAADVDVLLLKTDAVGNLVWEATFGGPGNDYGYGVQPTGDGGYIVVGTGPGGEVNPEADALLLKTDAAGQLSWQKKFGNTQANYLVEGYAVALTEDGFILTGKAEGLALYLARTDTSGNLLWERIFAAPVNQQGNAVIVTADGGFAIVGQSEDAASGIADLYLLKTDAAGNKVWDARFGADGFDAGYDLRQTADGGYILTGTYSARSGDAYLVKTSATGVGEWEKTFGGDSIELGASVQLAVNGYVVVGSTFSAGAGGRDVYFLRTDAQGDVP